MQQIFNRKLKGLVLAMALTTAAGGVAAQNFVFNWNPRSGDVWVDTRLNDINQYGYRYREPFIDEMVRYYGAPRDLVHDLVVNQRWAPGDVYYACSIAHILGRPCREVVREWEHDHGQGWGVIAKRLGIKPGSAEFHRLKRGFVPTYDRWGRPIAIDADLRHDFPNRGHKPYKSGKSDGHGNSGHGMSHKAARSDQDGAEHGKSHKDDDHGNTTTHGKGKAGDAGGKGKSAKGKSGKKGKGKP